MLSARAVCLCDNYYVIFRLALLFLITKLQRIFEMAIGYVVKHNVLPRLFHLRLSCTWGNIVIL